MSNRYLFVLPYLKTEPVYSVERARDTNVQLFGRFCQNIFLEPQSYEKCPETSQFPHFSLIIHEKYNIQNGWLVGLTPNLQALK